MCRGVNNFYYTLISFIDINLLSKTIPPYSKKEERVRLLHLDKKYNINISILDGRCTRCTHSASAQP
jgi:hypothetical protein